MKRMLLISFLSIALVSFGEPNDWENVAITGINKEPPHATLMPFDSLEDATIDRSSSRWYRSLNGTWKFNWVKTPEERPMDFFRPDFDDSQWKTIPVPPAYLE